MTTVSSHIENSICTITLDRPDALNAFNSQMMHDLCMAFLQATEDETAKVIVLTGAGRAFSAGADLKSMGGTPDPDKKTLNEMLVAIIDCPKPFLIAANGLGVGIGMTILGLADLVIVAESAKFKAPFSSLGLTAEAASTYTFSRLMGHQQAAWVLLSSEWFSANQIVDMGLAAEVVPDDDVLDRTYEKARVLANLPLASLVQTKTLMQQHHRPAMKQAIIDEGKGLAALAGGQANREAIKAFLEKRQADFSEL